MKVFNKKYEAINDFRNYQPLPENFDEDTISTMMHSSKIRVRDNFKFGDYVLFRNIKEGKISRPIYGIFIRWNVWDMALVFNVIEKERAYIYNYSYISNPDINYEMCLGLCDPEVESFALWGDEDVWVLGSWSQKPTISELKSALYKSLPKDERRDLYLEQLGIK